MGVPVPTLDFVYVGPALLAVPAAALVGVAWIREIRVPTTLVVAVLLWPHLVGRVGLAAHERQLVQTLDDAGPVVARTAADAILPGIGHYLAACLVTSIAAATVMLVCAALWTIAESRRNWRWTLAVFLCGTTSMGLVALDLAGSTAWTRSPVAQGAVAVGSVALALIAGLAQSSDPQRWDLHVGSLMALTTAVLSGWMALRIEIQLVALGTPAAPPLVAVPRFEANDAWTSEVAIYIGLLLALFGGLVSLRLWSHRETIGPGAYRALVLFPALALFGRAVPLAAMRQEVVNHAARERASYIPDFDVPESLGSDSAAAHGAPLAVDGDALSMWGRPIAADGLEDALAREVQHQERWNGSDSARVSIYASEDTPTAKVVSVSRAAWASGARHLQLVSYDGSIIVDPRARYPVLGVHEAREELRVYDHDGLQTEEPSGAYVSFPCEEAHRDKICWPGAGMLEVAIRRQPRPRWASWWNIAWLAGDDVRWARTAATIDVALGSHSRITLLGWPEQRRHRPSRNIRLVDLEAAIPPREEFE